MRDLILVCFILGFVVASFKRPYFMALGYIWVDFLQPQKLTYWFLNSAPVARTIFSSSSMLSSEKVRTPCSK